MIRAAAFDSAETPLRRGITLIEASAGTGKTYAIAAIFLRLLLEHGLEVNEILVTTYTVPATAELRQRIRDRLREALAAFSNRTTDDPLLSAIVLRVNKDEAVQRLGRALRNFDEAAIHTIHSFCQQVLHDRAFESGLLFDATLIADQRALLREAADDYWRREFYAGHPFLAVVALQHKLSPAALVKLLEKMVSHPSLAIEPALSPGQFQNQKARLTGLFEQLRTLWQADAECISAHFTDENDWARNSHGDPEKMRHHLDRLAACFSNDGAAVDAFASLATFTRSKLKHFTRRGHDAPCHQFFDLCDELCAAQEEYVAGVRANFLTWAREELSHRKTEANLVSFDDLLTRLHTALHSRAGDALAAAVRARFHAALIDEFQDTDAIQEEIFAALFGAANDRWLFLIGDPKQAIYGFRGADIFTYLNAARRATERFTLAKNHRSESALVAAINHLFGRATNPFVLPEIEFRPVEAAGALEANPLLAGGEREPPLQIWHWRSEEPIRLHEAREQLPRIVAAEIARLLTGDVRIGDQRVMPRDIAVLVAKHVEARSVQAALAAAGVPSVLQSTGNVFHSREAGDLHAIMAAVAEPGREPLFRAALVTDALGLTAAELDELAGNERLWEERLLRFHRYREMWACTGFVQMFRKLFQAEHIRVRLLALPDGERRLTNFVHLAELLHATATERRLSPVGLVKWLAAQRNAQSATLETHELRLERDDDAVRIVTMHRSKGLEYEIVFCPFTSGRPERRKRNKRGELERGEPITFHENNHERRLTLDVGSSQWAEHEKQASQEQLAEQVRLFYVALTRARRRCSFVSARFEKCPLSAPAWLLHSPHTPEDDTAALLRAEAAGGSAERLAGQLVALSADAGGTIAIVNPPSPVAPRYASATYAEERREPRKFRGQIETDWAISSFTSLTLHRDEEEPDYDRGTPAHVAPDSAQEGGSIHTFAGGIKTGICMHEIFEELDFCNDAAIDPLVHRKLAAFSFDPSIWAAPVGQCVRRALQVELHPGLQLRNVPFAARLTELEFHFPVRHLHAGALQSLLRAEIAGRLRFEARRGLLKGFIDLIFESAGRFYIVDWKSNQLGGDADAYGEASLSAAMTRHHYTLQYHLYVVALHRYLRLRLGRSYNFETHFGGVFYLFLRGLDPAKPHRGVYRARPAADTVAQLEALFDRG